MKFIMILTAISLVFFMYIPTLHALHIFQQNRYQIDRYLVWIKNTFHREAISSNYLFAIIPCIGIAIVKDFGLLMLLLFIYAYLLIKKEENTVYIKKLVFTNRIKRLFTMMLTLEVIGVSLVIIFLPNYLISLLAPLFYIIPWLLIILSASFLMPLEEAIRNHYMRDAKNILSQHTNLRTIGITGSYAKTSTKNIAYQILSQRYYCFMTPSSYNNKMGITISIRKYLKSLHEVFLCEMGADHLHEIDELSKFVEVDIAMITAVGPQHIQTFGSIENILHEKMRLVENLNKDGIAIMNRDNEYIRNYRIKSSCRKIWYGIDEKDVDYRAIDIRYHKGGTSFKVVCHNEVYEFTSKLLGSHNVMNILAGIALGDVLQVPFKDMQKAVKELNYIKHRLELVDKDNYTLIDNSYNSNPVSASYALDVLSRMDGRRILITPGFIDLGEIENEENRKFGRMMKSKCDEVILVGKRQTQSIMKGLIDVHMPYENVHVVKNIQEAFVLLQTIVKDGDTVLLENDLPDAFNH